MKRLRVVCDAIATRPGTVLRCTLPPLEHLHKRWQALVRVEPRSQVPGKRACSSNLDGRTHTSTGRPADGESRTGSRAARQVTRVVTLLRSGRGRDQAARPAWSVYQPIKQCRLEARHRPESDGQGAALASLSRASGAWTVRGTTSADLAENLPQVQRRTDPARCEIDVS